MPSCTHSTQAPDGSQPARPNPIDEILYYTILATSLRSLLPPPVIIVSSPSPFSSSSPRPRPRPRPRARHLSLSLSLPLSLSLTLSRLTSPGFSSLRVTGRPFSDGGVTARNYPVGMASLSPSPSLPLVPTDVVVLVTRTAPRITEASSARATSRGILV